MYFNTNDAHMKFHSILTYTCLVIIVLIAKMSNMKFWHSHFFFSFFLRSYHAIHRWKENFLKCQNPKFHKNFTVCSRVIQLWSEKKAKISQNQVNLRLKIFSVWRSRKPPAWTFFPIYHWKEEILNFHLIPIPLL